MISTSATNPGRWPSLAIAATLVMLGQGNALAQDQTQQSTLRQQALTEHNNKRALLQSTPALTLAPEADPLNTGSKGWADHSGSDRHSSAQYQRRRLW